MRKVLQKATLLAALAAFSMGGTTTLLAQDKKEEKKGQYTVNLYSGYSDGWYVSGDADAQVPLTDSLKLRATPYFSSDGEKFFNDWNQNNFQDESYVGLKNLYLELDKKDFAVGAGIKNISEAEDLRGLLKDPNDQNAWIGKSYPGFEPLGVPAAWATYKLSKDWDITGTVSYPTWSKVDPYDLAKDGDVNVGDPHGMQGVNYRLEANGEPADGLRVKGVLGYFNSPWPIARSDSKDLFEPDTYNVLSVGGQVEKDIGEWTLGVAGAYRNQAEHVDDIVTVVPSVAKRTQVAGNELVVRGSAILEAKVNEGDAKVQDEFDPRRYLANSGMLEVSYDIGEDIFTEAYGIYNPEKKASIVGANIGKQIDKNWAVGIGGAHTSGFGDRAAEWSVGVGLQYKF